VNKSSAVDPTAGGFSFKLGRPTAADSGTDVGSSADLGTTSSTDADTEKLDAVADTQRLIGPGARTARSGTSPNFDEKVTGRRKKS
jgi:hypothetical protein